MGKNASNIGAANSSVSGLQHVTEARLGGFVGPAAGGMIADQVNKRMIDKNIKAGDK